MNKKQPITKHVCHQLQGPNDYMAWHAWAEDQASTGRKHKKCEHCGFWYFDKPVPATPTGEEKR